MLDALLALLALLAMCDVEHLCGVGDGHAAFVGDHHSRIGAEARGVEFSFLILAFLSRGSFFTP